MAIKTTSLRDVLKNKLSDEIKVPTIWVDPDGNEHFEYDTLAILTADPQPFLRYSKYAGQKYLCVDGIIKQVGSNVITCGPLISKIIRYAYLTKYPYDLSKTFKYARNLEALVSTLSYIGYDNTPLEIPEDIFWGCPKLKNLASTFRGSFITSIPSRLFEKCPDLKFLIGVFEYCESLKSVPSDLFKNNKNIYSLKDTFAYSGIEDVPKALLEPLVEDKRGYYSLNLEGLFYETPFSKTSGARRQKLTLQERVDKLTKLVDRCFPENLRLVDVDKIISAGNYDFRLDNPFHCTDTMAEKRF